MHTITVIRDHVAFGPYQEAMAIKYFSEGKILLNDIVYVDGSRKQMTFSAAVSQCGWKLPSPMNPFDVIKKIGIDSMFPIEASKKEWRENRSRIILIVLVGLVPLLALTLNIPTAIYAVFAMYVSVLWGMFFWSIFKTDTSSVKNGAICFCTTALVSTTLLGVLLSMGWLETFNSMIEGEDALVRTIGFFFRAGIPEEICKALVVFWIVRRPGLILKPQDVVLYGLLSGFGFGIHEGLQYQLYANRALNDIDATYIFNILRLTSLPFLHACWCGIASYFIAYAALVPMCRFGLWMVAILIPAFLHTIYDAFNGGLIGMLAAVASVVMMMSYLSNAKLLRRKLL